MVTDKLLELYYWDLSTSDKKYERLCSGKNSLCIEHLSNLNKIHSDF